MASAAALLCVASVPAMAQQQTADGAQKFLQTILERPDVSASVVLLGVHDSSPYPWMLPVGLLISVRKIDSTDEAGKPNPCVTAIRELDHSSLMMQVNVQNTSTSPWEVGITAADPYVLPATAQKYKAPIYVEWGKTQVGREEILNKGHKWAWVAARKGTFDKDAYFRVSTTDVTLLDRIEYAMKFLQASCDQAAATGF